jgi:hypothetical protein
MNKHVLHRMKTSILFPSIGFSKLVLIFLGILIIVLLFDQSILRIYSYAASPYESNLRLAVFMVIASVSIIGQYVLTALLRYKTKETKQTFIKIPHVLVALTQYLLIALLTIIVLDILLFSRYSNVILQIVVTTSYALSIVAFSFLAFYLIKWYSSRRSYIVLLYAISSSIFVSSFIFLIIFFVYVTSNFPAQIQLHHHNLPYFNNPGSPTFVAYNGYTYLTIASFIVTWIATVTVLHGYSKKLGRTKYWLVVSLPLVYFLSQFITFFGGFLTSWIGPDPVFYGVTLPVIFTVSQSVGGMFFGLAFWMMARALKKAGFLQDYLRITGIGFMLLFVTDEAIVLIFVPYPPFGIASVMFVGLASYYILVGLYYSAISIANDIHVRKHIYSSALNELSMLGSIGTARSEEQISRVVSQILAKHEDLIKKEIDTPSIEDVKDYTAGVIEELEKHKKRIK